MNASPTKVALVTGAAGDGIGHAVVHRLAQEGYSVVLTDVHQRRLDAALADLRDDHPGEHAAMRMDVTDRTEIAGVIAEINAQFGHLDVVVNNAFLVIHSDEADAWDACLATNLTGPWNVATASRPLLSASAGGSIVNLTTAAADLGKGTRVNFGYIAGKGGLNTLTRAIANSWGHLGIRCNGVSMYAVTGTRATDQSPDDYVEPLTRTALGRFPDADEIANAVAFLCSSEARSITGEILNVSAGYYMRS